MRTAGPATRTTFPRQNIPTKPFNMLLTRLRFLHRNRPTNPLVTAKWRELVPGVNNFRSRT